MVEAEPRCGRAVQRASDRPSSSSWSPWGRPGSIHPSTMNRMRLLGGSGRRRPGLVVGDGQHLGTWIAPVSASRRSPSASDVNRPGDASGSVLANTTVSSSSSTRQASLLSPPPTGRLERTAHPALPDAGRSTPAITTSPLRGASCPPAPSLAAWRDRFTIGPEFGPRAVEHVGEEAVAGGVDQVEHVGEAVGAAVVGVGDVEPGIVEVGGPSAGDELEQQADLGLGSDRGPGRGDRRGWPGPWRGADRSRRSRRRGPVGPGW